MQITRKKSQTLSFLMTVVMVLTMISIPMPVFAASDAENLADSIQTQFGGIDCPFDVSAESNVVIVKNKDDIGQPRTGDPLIITIPSGVTLDWQAAWSATLGDGESAIEISSGSAGDFKITGSGTLYIYAENSSANVTAITNLSQNTSITINTTGFITGSALEAQSSAGIKSCGPVTVISGEILGGGGVEAFGIKSEGADVVIQGGVVGVGSPYNGPNARAISFNGSGELTIEGEARVYNNYGVAVSGGIDTFTLRDKAVIFGKAVTTEAVIGDRGISAAGNSIIIAWTDTTGKLSYDEDSRDDLAVTDPSNKTAKWGKDSPGSQSYRPGIYYNNDDGSGNQFFEVSVLRLRIGAGTPSQSAQEQTSHTHTYQWQFISDPTLEQDGIEQYVCSCGDVKETLVIPAAQVYIKGLYGEIKDAAAGTTIEYNSRRWNGISDYVIKKLAERADVTLKVTFEYKNATYTFTLPAGTNYESLLNDEEAYYGFFTFCNLLGIPVTQVN